MLKRWTERTKPICPLNLKTGDKGCYSQCLYNFEDGETPEGEKLHGCSMGDEMQLRVEKLKGESLAKNSENWANAKQIFPVVLKKRGRPAKITDQPEV
jgi:hypothetical protein